MLAFAYLKDILDFLLILKDKRRFKYSIVYRLSILSVLKSLKRPSSLALLHSKESN